MRPAPRDAPHPELLPAGPGRAAALAARQVHEVDTAGHPVLELLPVHTLRLRQNGMKTTRPKFP